MGEAAAWGGETYAAPTSLIRKYVRGGRIVAIEQPPFERVLHIGTQHPESNTTLIVEVMGRYSNIVLVAEEGLILECIKRVGPEKSRYRSMLPRHLYVPPPPQPKLDPTDVTELRLRDILSDASPESPIWRALVEGIGGVSRLMAREVVHRAMGDAEAAISQMARISPSLEAFQEMLMPVWEHCWQPSIVKRNERLVAFAPYPLTQYDDWEEVDSISQAVELIMGRWSAGMLTQQPSGEQGRLSFGPGRGCGGSERLWRDRGSRRRRRRNCGARGEMILAYAHRIEPGQRELAVPVGSDEPPVLIELDPCLSEV